MKPVCVVTGGGSGMGLATAKLVAKTSTVLIAGRSQQKLDAALGELRAQGAEAEALACDVADRRSVDRLVARASELGSITGVVHSAGLSPRMGTPRVIMEGNALGTINVSEAFSAVMPAGSCIVDVSSMAAHMLPTFLVPTRSYELSHLDPERFLERMMARVELFPKSRQAGVAYGISKHFVVWRAKSDAVRLGPKGLRVLSVSPGSFETPMGALEQDATSGYTAQSPLGRTGRVEEIASLLAFCASDQAGYLTGVDIVCDGGCLAVGASPLDHLWKEFARRLGGEPPSSDASDVSSLSVRGVTP